MNKFAQIISGILLLLTLISTVHLAEVMNAEASTFRVVQTRAISLYSGISASATSLRVTPYPKDLDGTKLTITDFGDNPTLTVDPKVLNYEEILQFTTITDNGDNTATLGGVTHVSSKYPYTAAGTGKAHGASATVVFANNPQVYGRLAAKENNESITGVWTYSSTSLPKLDYNPTAAGWTGLASTTFVTLGKLADTALASAIPATETAVGYVELATALEQASSTATGGTGANLVIQSKNATDTPTYGCAVGYTGTAGAGCTVVASLAGKIKQTFLDIFTTVNVWTAQNTFNASTTITATTTLATTTVLGRNVTAFFGGDGTDGALSISSGTTTLNANGQTTLVKNYTSIAITGTAALTISNPNANGTVLVLRSQGACTITSSTSTGAIFLMAAGGTGGTAGGATGGDGGSGSDSDDIIDTLSHFGGGGTSGGVGTAGSAFQGFSHYATSSAIQALKTVFLVPGTGGGGGRGGLVGGSNGGGAGGRGAGSVYLECGGYLNITGTINASGIAGSDGTAGSGAGGGGGGGSGGMIVIIYNQLIANSGTYTVTAGAGGAGGAGGANTGGAGGGSGGMLYNAGTAGTGASGANGGPGATGAVGYSMVMKNNTF